MTWSLGLDIGGTKIAVGAVNESGEVRHAINVPTPAREGAAAILRAAIEAGMQVCAHAARERITIAAIGVGAAGQIEYPRGRVRYASATLSGWAGTEIAQQLHAAFQLPVTVDNDVNVFALGEHRHGAGRGLADVLFVAVGTGVGGALILSGELRRGHTYSAGEIGHVLVDYDGVRLCNCGQPGHLEAYASGPAIAARYRERAHLAEAVDLRLVAERAHHGDSHARHAIAEGATLLGRALCGVLNLLDPEALILGGGVTELGEVWWEPLTRALRATPMPGPAQIIVKRAELSVQAGLIGAGVLAFDQRATHGNIARL